jgi:hypothetical protein
MHPLVMLLVAHHSVADQVAVTDVVEPELVVVIMIVVHDAKLVQNAFVQNSNKRLSVSVA